MPKLMSRVVGLGQPLWPTTGDLRPTTIHGRMGHSYFGPLHGQQRTRDANIRSTGERLATAVQTHEITIEIGGMAVCVRTESAEFRRMLEERYVGFVADGRGRDAPDTAAETAAVQPGFVLDVELLPDGAAGADEDVRVRREGERWVLTRGDFRAEWEAGHGWVRQTANPYAIDSVLRIVHTLLLAEEGGFLLHGASAIRNGKAFLFSGVSGAGKTTISRLAPGDVTLLTDEISYIRKSSGAGKGPSTRAEALARDDRSKSPGRHQDYLAFGTPFAGELAKVGDNVSAPIAALYFLEKGPKNRVEEIGRAEALQRLMRNILFFAEDERLVQQVFEAAGDFLAQVPAYRLEFVPDQRVWELIG